MKDLKRESLSDITNRLNLKPIADLRKLVASTSRKPSSLSKIPKTNSTSTEQNLCSEVSNTSAGSSDVGKSRNPETSKFQTPLGTRKDKGKAIGAPLNSSAVAEIKDNQVEISIAHCSGVRKNGIQKGNVSLSSGFEGTAIPSTSSEKGKSVDSSGSEAIGFARECSTNLHSCSSGKVNGKTEDTGTKSSSSSSSHQNTMMILQPSNIPDTKNLESISDALTVNAPSTRRKTEKRKRNDSIGSFSCPPATNKSKSEDQNESEVQPSKSRTASPIAKKKRFSSVAPPDVFKNEIAFFTELDAEELVIEEVSSDELD